MPPLLFSQWQLPHILNRVISHIEQSYFTYWTQLLHVLNTVTSRIEQNYFTYWTRLLHILNTVTSHTEHSYFTYWTQLLHILNRITSHTEHSYFIYWTELLHILNTVTSHIEHGYFTYWTQLLHILNTVTSYIECHRLLYVFGSCQYWISAIISGFVAVLFSPPERFSTSNQTTTVRCTPSPAHHSLTILPFAQFHLLTGPLTTNEHLRLPAPWKHETWLEARLHSCLTSALDVSEGSVIHCSCSIAGGKGLQHPQNRRCVGPKTGFIILGKR